MKLFFILGVIAGAVLLVVYWSPSNRKKFEDVRREVKYEVAKRKNDTRKELVDLKRSINIKIDKVSDELKKANTSKRVKLIKIKKELSVKRDKIQTKIDSIDSALQNSWNTVHRKRNAKEPENTKN